MPIASSYWWKDELCHESEFLLLVKTVASLSEKVCTLIHQLHPYELPEICTLPITAGLPEYLQWIRDETQR
jgi:periplasmic divalent cation tolerance protein